MTKLQIWYVSKYADQTIAEGAEASEVMDKTEEYLEQHAYDHVFTEGVSNGDVHEFEYDLETWDEHGDLVNISMSHIVEYYHGDYKEHNTLW